jgi:hypothetical protein
MANMSKLKTVLGWTWAIFCGLGALAALVGAGSTASFGWRACGALSLLVCGAMSLPPLWQAIRKREIAVATWARWAIGFAAFLAYGQFLPSKNYERPAATASSGAEQSAQSSATSEKPKSLQSDELAQIEAKFEKGAVSPMSKDAYPKMYAKLGTAAFERANDLTRWAAVAIARSKKCSKLDDFGVSDDSTRKEIRWYGYCDGAKTVPQQFIVTEAQAIAARTAFDPKATADARAAAAKVAAVEQRQDRWKDFDEAAALTACDQTVTSSAVNRRSVDIAWGRDIQKDDETMRVIIERDFEAGNAMGGTISSRYRCELDGNTGRITKLMIRELTGWHKVL